jgi:hypothetical protein
MLRWKPLSIAKDFSMIANVYTMASKIADATRSKAFARRHYVAPCVSVDLPRLRINLAKNPRRYLVFR